MLVVYGPALAAPFLYDDYQNIVDNPYLRASRLDAALVGAFRGPTLRPVAYLSFALDYRLGGPEAWGFHLVNLGVHAANAVFVALLARATLTRLAQPPGRREALGLALASGLLFAVHPLQTQSVSYVVQRMTSLATLFSLIALWAWLRGRLRGPGRERRLWWLGAGGAWLLALGSKEIAVALPAGIWLYEWLFFRGGDPAFARRSLLRAGLPLAAAGALAYLWLFQGSGYAGRDFGPGERLLTELRVVAFYASLVVWPQPSRLNLLHDFPVSHSLLDPPATLAAGLLLAAAGGAALLLARRAPLASFAVAWFVLMLALESFVLPLALVYEHRTYLPMVGVALAAPWALFVATGRRASRALPLLLVLAALLGWGTWTRNRVWRDELGFWSDVAAKSPELAGARNNLGLALQRAGRGDEAVAEYRAALELDPADPEVHSNLGSALLEQGHRVEAVAHFREALRLDPGHYRAHYNLGRSLALAGDLDAGAAHVETAARLAPWDASVWNGLGAVRELQGRLPEALAAFERALALDPSHAEAAHNREVLRRRLSVPSS